MKRASGARFLVLEGPDGSGKTTQAGLLVSWLAQRGLEALHVRDPGGTRIGEKIRRIVLDPEHTELARRTETLLFMASRSQLIAETIAPALAEGRVVVCERWLPSTVCYQGYAGDLDPEEIWRLGEAASRTARPDLTLIIDVAPSVGLFRIGDEPDLLESRSSAYHERVRQGYLEIAKEGRMNSRLIPAGTIEEIAERIRGAVDDVL